MLACYVFQPKIKLKEIIFLEIKKEEVLNLETFTRLGRLAPNTFKLYFYDFQIIEGEDEVGEYSKYVGLFDSTEIMKQLKPNNEALYNFFKKTDNESLILRIVLVFDEGFLKNNQISAEKLSQLIPICDPALGLTKEEVFTKIYKNAEQ